MRRSSRAAWTKPNADNFFNLTYIISSYIVTKTSQNEDYRIQH